MRVQPYTVGSIVHVVKRGARGMEIVRDDTDRWRFTKSLYLLNDSYQDENWHRDTINIPLYERPAHWPERDPLTSVLAWTLMPNHFHLLLMETKEGGVSKFMQRLGGSMSLYSNLKYKEQGSLFQGSYKSRTVDKEEYLRYVFPYIVVKNVLELYPRGLTEAIKDFDKAWKWASEYPFSSLGSAALGKGSPILDPSQLSDLGLPGENFKQVALDMLLAHTARQQKFAPLMLEKW